MGYRTLTVDFCHDGFLNFTKLERNVLRPSSCFQFTLLAVPAVYMLFIISFSVYMRKRRPVPVVRIPFSHMQSLHLFLVLCNLITSAILICCVALSDIHSKKAHLDVVRYLSMFVNFLSLVSFALLSERLRRLHQPRSQLLFTYLLLLFLSTLPRLYGLFVSSANRQPPDAAYTVTSISKIVGILERIQLYTVAVNACTTFALILTQFFSPYKRENSLISDKNACPVLWASVPSLWMFTWLTSLIWKAYRGRVNSSDDVFSVSPENEVERNFLQFHLSWQLFKSRIKRAPTSDVSIDCNNGTGDRIPLLGESTNSLPDQSETGSSIRRDSALAIPTVAFRDGSSARLKPRLSSTNTSDACIVASASKRINGTKEQAWLLFRALFAAFGTRLIGAWLLLFISTLLDYASPVLLGFLLRFLASPSAPDWEGHLIAVVMFAFGLVTTICGQQGFHRALTLGVSVRSALTSAIYRKSMRLSAEARSWYTSGELVNVLSVDVNRIMESFIFSFLVWRALLQFVVSFVLLWNQLGLATLAGIGCLILMLPLNLFCMWLAQKFETSEMQWKDKRLKCLSEIFAAIKVIKMYAWERAFEKQTTDIRKQELGRLARISACWCISEIIWTLAPYLILLVTFVTFTWEHLVHIDGKIPSTNTTVWVPELLNPERIFVSVNLFNMMRTPLILLPWSLSATIMAYVSVKRIATLLLSGELDDYVIKSLEDSTDAIQFKDASFSWTTNGPLVLQNINLTVKQGSLVAVLGAVGSGKSSLLSACLGDLNQRGGSVSLQGTTAYVPQTAWIQQQTVRANICLGESSDQLPDPTSDELKWAWYQTVLSACALQPDLNRLPAADLTEIGERGVNLSGGQRQRISLARAVYQNADVYLLDDPFSAVDSHVAQHLFDGDIVDNTQGHFAEYLRILEEQLSRTKGANKRSVSKHNNKDLPVRGIGSLCETSERISSQQHSNELQPIRRSSAIPTFNQTGNLLPIRDPVRSPPRVNGITRRVSVGLMESELLSSTEKEVANSQDDREATRCTRRRKNREISKERETASIEVPSGTRNFQTSTAVDSGATTSGTEQEFGRFLEDEEVNQGHISWSAYANYIVARGLSLTVISILFYALFLGAQTFGNYWLQWFADDHELIENERLLHNESVAHNDSFRLYLIGQITERTFYYMSGYAFLGLGLMFVLLVSEITRYISAIKASKAMHQTLLSRILRAPMAFFERTPSGRLLNRFSNDIDNLDHSIPESFMDVIACFGDTALSLLIVIIALRPIGIGLAIVGPLSLICVGLQMLYLPCSRQARRLDAVTRSPLLSNFAETAASSLGSSMVRAYDRTSTFTAIADRLVDGNAAHTFVYYSSNRWLDVHLNIFCRLTLLVTIIALITGRAQMSPGLAGLIITYVLETGDNFAWFVKQLAQLETSAVSLERLREYSCVDQEASWENGPDSPPPADWPAPCCEILFNKTTVTYPSYNAFASQQMTGEDSEAFTSDSDASEHPRSPLTPLNAVQSIDLHLGGSPSKRRIGVVGRTGAGKSTLATCLFRIVEPVILEEDREQLESDRANQGPVIVDGVDICRIGLHELRSRFSILPQEPVLFSGSLRFNLDPFGRKSDNEIWSALEAAHLSNWVTSDGITLDYECGEGGCNLSAGQKQLVCLARIYLSSGGRVRLLVLDEATSAMDPMTDQLVMRTVVGDQFKDATVIIIAHRLNTVLDTDMIVVMDHGYVVETGHPRDLLNNPFSRFANMHRAAE
ncbi:hypothetical protein EG68_02798 [Paragonimus skrjabini miyazakii]|uniref:Uncharacterized protein n=1 Tax=Paragonimus skrjabini miyazakii TaxID=59628 RepID=A0A8S9Z337_9TREM|nr:hypothetical protein EG68_02798 [Paragonimus skrjabini miyazakii]